MHVDATGNIALRSGRQKLESDRFDIVSGVRHGRTLGSPVAITIENAEWAEKYRDVMAVEAPAEPVTFGSHTSLVQLLLSVQRVTMFVLPLFTSEPGVSVVKSCVTPFA